MSEKIRLDKWLWQARFFKTRSLSAKTVSTGHVRVNSLKIAKPAYSVGPGDVLTFPQARAVRVIKVIACGTRRGPAPEAQALYKDLAPPEAKPEPDQASSPKFDGKGRPTKRDRRQLDRTQSRNLGPDRLE
ncbi:MAG: RNA-binding S4 domain-containing protein [Pseudomonadota bacterium]